MNPWRKLVLSEIVSLALSVGLYFVLTIWFGVESDYEAVALTLTVAALAFVVSSIPSLGAPSGYGCGTLLFSSIAILSLVAYVEEGDGRMILVGTWSGLSAAGFALGAIAEEEGLKYKWMFLSLSIEAGSIFGALTVGGLAGLGIAAGGVVLLAGLLLLPERYYLKAQTGAVGVAGTR